MQQPSFKNRSFIVVAVFLIASLFIVGAMLLPQDNSEGTGDEQRGAAPVVIIVVDDFGNHLGRIVEQLPDEPAKRAAENIRQAIQINGEIRVDEAIRTEVDARVEELQGSLRGTARDLLAQRAEVDLDDANCAITPEGTGFFATDGTGFFATDGTGFFATDGTGQPGRATHGDRVQGLVEELLATYGKGYDIRVERVDTAGFDIDAVTQRLTDTIEQIWRREPNAQIVVNMSFAVIPCDVVPDLAVYDKLMRQFDPELQEDLLGLQEIFRTIVTFEPFNRKLAGGGTYNAVFCENERIPEQAARARERLCQVENDPNIVLIGASGNGVFQTDSGRQVGADFPFYPAAWGEVISVSASESDADFLGRPPREPYSNPGDVIMAGRWEVAPDRTLIGTSFAAPRYSVLTALHLAGASGSGLDIGCGAGVIPAPVPPTDWASSPANPADQPPC